MKRYLIVLLVFTSCAGGNGEFNASGVFEATEVMVSARGSGELIYLQVAEGQDVMAGKEVGLIDTTQLHFRKLQLEASVQNVPTQTAALVQQLDNQRHERARFEKLVRENAATQKQLDDIDAAVALIERQLAAQRDALTATNENLAASLAQIEDQINKSLIISPISGVVLAKYAEQGELAAVGRPLFKVGELTSMYLRVYVTADQLTSMKIGQKIAVFADWGKNGRREYEGTVSWIADRAEFTPKTIQTRDERTNLVYAVKVAVTNDGYIKVGMYGDVKF